MSSKSTLDLKGIIRAYPIAELVLEIAQAGLSGSLRIQHGEQKSVIYFVDGQVVYAVSNQRIFRLAEILLSSKLIEKKFLAENPTIANDLQLADALVAKSVISADDVSIFVGGLCESVIGAAFVLTEGEWIYSPHVRLKAGLSYPINIVKLMVNFARSASPEMISERLTNPNEWFGVKGSVDDAFLEPQEAFMLSRLEENLTLDQLVSVSGLPRPDALRAIYVLWLAGCLSRYGWEAAFTENRIDALRSASLELKHTAKPAAVAEPPKPKELPKEEPEEESAQTAEEFDLETTLARIESADNYYQILGIERSVKIPAIRKAYFRLAKLLHPDRYHNESSELLIRVEKAFTELAQAHETLKSPDTRQSYDLRLQRAEKDKEQNISTGAEVSRQDDQAAKDFERGFDLQLNGEFEAALPYLARAVYYSPKNARYHAYYGKTLAADDAQRHKAQNELLTAVQLEPTNAAFRLLLAEFYIKYKLPKRAEGELNRLLEMSPGNREAKAMLDSLQAKSLN